MIPQHNRQINKLTYPKGETLIQSNASLSTKRTIKRESIQPQEHPKDSNRSQGHNSMTNLQQSIRSSRKPHS